MPLPKNFLPQHPFDHGNFSGRDESLLKWPRSERAIRDLLRLYYSVIDDLDTQVGRILHALETSGQLENTIVIFASDHGMACGSHGLRGKQNQYEHTINVPLLISGPGIASNQETSAQVYLRDLYPTTCDLVGAPLPGSVTAKSFAEVLRGTANRHRETIFGYFTDTQRMIRTDRWKLIHYPQAARWQLFDVESDPFELKNRYNDPELDEVRDQLRKELLRWREQQGDPLLD